MALDDTGTVLTISVMGVPYYSARGLQQTLAAIDQAKNFERTVNGALRNLAPTGFQKYKTTITCTDVNGPAIDPFPIGLQVTVECVAELSYPAAGSPSRTVVDGSSRQEGDHIKYRPALDMIVVDFTEQKDEFGAVTQWELDLEEV